jgi:hypothetical protein
MGIDGLSVVHAIPGRIRVKIPKLKSDEELARAIPEWLVGVFGIQRVEASALTGSVLVLYDPEQLTPQALGGMLPALLPGVDLRGIDLAQALSGPAVSPPGVAVKDAVSGFFGAVNAGVAEVTQGLDLNILFPLVLFTFGIRSLLVSEQLTPVPWYNLLWFSFTGYLALNRPKGTPAQ